MAWKFIVGSNIRKLERDKLRQICSSEAIPEKEKILLYLKQFEPCAFTSEPVRDLFNGKIVLDANNGFSDGEYRWYASEIYHFEQYNLSLNDDFIEHVLQQ